jgi:hypothetical protein
VTAVVASLDLFSPAAEPGRECAFLLLLAFLASFLFIRTSARLARSPRVSWWPGSVEAGGVHLHHLVWGISLVLLAGFAAFVSDLYSPWWQITSIAFGIGAGLTLDEFALLVYLRDVYWSTEGRDSIDAVIVAALLAGLVTAGVQAFDLDQTAAAAGTTAGIALVAALAAVTFMKGRLLLGSCRSSCPWSGSSPRSGWQAQLALGAVVLQGPPRGASGPRAQAPLPRPAPERHRPAPTRRHRRSAERRLTHAARAASGAAVTGDCGVAVAATPGSGRRPSSSAVAALASTAAAHSAKPAW